MTDWAAQSVIFIQNLPKTYPKMSENCPNTALKLLPNPPKIRIVSEKRRLPEHYPDM